MDTNQRGNVFSRVLNHRYAGIGLLVFGVAGGAAPFAVMTGAGNRALSEAQIREANLRKTLSSTTIYFPDLNMQRSIEDVNGDGTNEQVLSVTNPNTGKLERFLVESYEGQVRFRPFEVTKGQIQYK